MTSSNLAFDKKIKNILSTNSSSSGNPGTSGSMASFYYSNLDNGQRKLSGVHVQMYVHPRCLIYISSSFCHKQVRCMCCTYYPGRREHHCLIHTQISGVIASGTGLFLGLGQLLSTTGPLGVILVFILVGSVASAFVPSIIPNSPSDIEVVYFVAPWCLLRKWLCSIRFLDPSHITVCHHLPEAMMTREPRAFILAGRWVDPALGFAVSI